MKKNILTILMVAIFLTINAQDSIEQSYNVVLTIKRKIPYCGGTYPTPEQENKMELEVNNYFIIQYKQGYGDSLWVKEFKTDSFGKIRCNLPKGYYCLKRAIKNIPFDDFYKIHKKENDKYNIYGDSTCYYNWWKSCEFTFERNDEIKSIEMEVLIMARCYTGEDPCHRYIGPYPP